MAKRQIKISESAIKELVRNTIRESFGVDKAIEKGVWSSDDPEAADDIKKIEDDDRFQASWFGYNDPGNEMSDLMYKRAKGEDSELPREKGYGMGLNTKAEDERMRELFGDEEKEGKMYDENPEGEENLYFGDPDLEEKEDEDDIAGISEGRQIKLNESQLREFISYSVARILREGYGRSYDVMGNQEYEYSNYGYDSLVIEPDLDEFIDELENGNDEGDAFVRELDRYGMWPVRVNVEYNVEEGMKGDGYLQPNDPDEYTVEGWEIIGEDKIQNQKIKALLHRMVELYMEDFNIEEELASQGRLNEEFQAENPYKDMSWSEYLEAKKGERKEEEERAELKKLRGKEKENMGIMAHFETGKEFQAENPYKDLTWNEYVEAKKKERKKAEERAELDRYLNGLNKGKEKGENLGPTIHFELPKKH